MFCLSTTVLHDHSLLFCLFMQVWCASCVESAKEPHSHTVPVCSAAQHVQSPQGHVREPAKSKLTPAHQHHAHIGGVLPLLAIGENVYVMGELYFTVGTVEALFIIIVYYMLLLYFLN